MNIFLEHPDFGNLDDFRKRTGTPEKQSEAFVKELAR